MNVLIRVKDVLRTFCPHRWRYVGRQLRCFGMGSEHFDVYRCDWCGDEGDQFPDKTGWHGGSRNWMNHGRP